MIQNWFIDIKQKENDCKLINFLKYLFSDDEIRWFDILNSCIVENIWLNIRVKFYKVIYDAVQKNNLNIQVLDNSKHNYFNQVEMMLFFKEFIFVITNVVHCAILITKYVYKIIYSVKKWNHNTLNNLIYKFQFYNYVFDSFNNLKCYFSLYFYKNDINSILYNKIHCVINCLFESNKSLFKCIVDSNEKR